ncbi:MAG: YceI family protein [Caulobacteraceae bacterium]
MKPTHLLAAALAVLAAPAAAQVQGPEAVQAGTYVIDSKETLVRYSTIHMGLNEFWGTFPGATGILTIDPKDIASAKLSVSVPILTVETTNRELNGEFISTEFFDAGKYPTMTFVSTAVARTGERTARVTGNLTLHGITRPVTLDVTFNGVGPNAFSKVPTLGFRAVGLVRRSDFGLAKYVPIVSDETAIAISAAFELKK